MIMQLSVLLDRSRPESLTAQLVEQLRDAIRCARIAPGTRLPSSRRLSEQLAISRNTVVRAYDELVMEGMSSRVRRPAFMSPSMPPDAAPGRPPPILRDIAPHTRMPMPLRHARAHDVGQPARNRLLFRLLSGPAQRGSVSAQDLAPAAAGRPVPWRRVRGSRNMAIRPACRRCARRSPTIWRRRAASSPIPAGS